MYFLTIIWFVVGFIAFCTALTPNDCQCRTRLTSRIYGGVELENAIIYPWMGSLGRLPDTPWDEHPDVYKKQDRLLLDEKYRKQSHICGAIILNQYYVLTVAHCLKKHNHTLDKSDVAVGFGSNLIQIYNRGRKRVQQLILHPYFERGGVGSNEYSKHDIALIKLAHPISFSKDSQLKPACLLTKGLTTGSQSVLSAVGFGGTGPLRMSKKNYEQGKYPEAHLSSRLRLLHLMDVSLTYPTCIKHPHLLCTQALNGKGSLCLGDSGGPLQLTRDGRVAVIGLSSFSDERFEGDNVYACERSSMFTRISENMDWIRKHVEKDFCEF